MTGAPLAEAAAGIAAEPADGPCFRHSLAPAFVVAKMPGAVVAGRGGPAVLEAPCRIEDQ